MRHLESKNESLKRQKQDQLVHKDDEILELRAKLREKDGEICSVCLLLIAFVRDLSITQGKLLYLAILKFCTANHLLIFQFSF